MKHVWQCSTRAPIGTPAGPGSSTLVGQTSTQRLQPVQRSRTINSNMGGPPLPFGFGSGPYLIEAADQQAPRLLGFCFRGIFTLVHASALVASEGGRVGEASRGHDAGGLASEHGVGASSLVMIAELTPGRLEHCQRVFELGTRAKHILVERQDLVLCGFEHAASIHGFHTAAWA